MYVPHEWFSLIPHQSQGDLAGLSEETLSAHGPHGVDHILGQTERNHLWHIKCLPLVDRERRSIRETWEKENKLNRSTLKQYIKQFPLYLFKIYDTNSS